MIQESEVAEAMPVAMGGEIVDGTYFQTGDIHYVSGTPDPPDEEIRGTLVIAGSVWRRLYADGADVAAGMDACIVWNVTASGTELTVDGSTQFSYTATPTGLALYTEGNSITYALQ